MHRDLKPENVMVDGDGNVKVLDFGLAKIHEPLATTATPSTPSLAETALSPTEEGRVVGTPGYMAPEQTRSPAVDARADLFSFGVILYEMLAGVRPFTGATAFDVLVATARDEPIPLASHRPDVTAEVVAIVERCLRKESTARFAAGLLSPRPSLRDQGRHRGRVPRLFSRSRVLGPRETEEYHRRRDTRSHRQARL